MAFDSPLIVDILQNKKGFVNWVILPEIVYCLYIHKFLIYDNWHREFVNYPDYCFYGCHLCGQHQVGIYVLE